VNRRWAVTDSTMQATLSKMSEVETVSLRVVNKIRRVEPSSVWVRSERTGNDRKITFESIRNWSRGRQNSRVRLALAVALGLAKSPD
jgi:hypothetical protein